MSGFWLAACGIGVAVGSFALGCWWASQIHENKRIIAEYWCGEVARLPQEQVFFARPE